MRKLLILLAAGSFVLGVVLTAQAAERGNSGAGKLEAKAKGAEKKVEESEAAAGQGKAGAKGAMEKGEKKAAEAQAGMEEEKGKATERLGRQGEAIDAQMETAEAKHRERIARIERIRDVLKEQGDEKGVERAEKLLAKENARYERKMTKLKAHDAAAAARFEKRMQNLQERGLKTEKPEGKMTPKAEETAPAKGKAGGK